MKGESRKDTGERLRDAAIRLFDRNGYSATGIRELAREADVSVASLYHHMDTKNALLLDLMLEGMHRLLEPATKLLSSQDSAIAHMRGLVDLHIRFHCEHAGLAKVTDVELRSLTVPDRTRIVMLRDKYESLWFDTIVRGIKEEDWYVEEPRISTFALLEMCTGVYHWYSPGGRVSVSRLSRLYGDMALKLLDCRH